MKTFFASVLENTGPISRKLLFFSFMAGYLLATLLFVFFRPQIHHLLNSILQGL